MQPIEKRDPEEVFTELPGAAAPVNSDNNKKKEETKMADVDTIMLSQEHADIRREGAEHTATLRYNIKEGTNEGVKETLKSGWAGVDATKDARYDIATRVDSAADRMVSQIDKQYHATEGRQVDILRDLARVQATADLNREVYQSGAEKAMLHNQVESLKNTQYLADKISREGDETRALINDLKYHDLNRALVERNAELTEERWGRRHYRGVAEQSQWAALNTQLQAFGSQLQETRQGMVNFGTMAGVGQTSSSNNV